MKLKSNAPFLLILLAGAVYSFWTFQHANQVRREQFLQQVSVIAAAVPDPATLPEGTSGVDPVWLRESLRRLLARVDNGSHLYVLQRHQGEFKSPWISVHLGAADPMSGLGHLPMDFSRKSELPDRCDLSFLHCSMWDLENGHVTGFAPIRGGDDAAPAWWIRIDADGRQWRQSLWLEVLFPVGITVLTLLVALWGRRRVWEPEKQGSSSSGSRNESLITLIFGLLITAAVTFSVCGYERAERSATLRQIGIFKAGELTRLLDRFREDGLAALTEWSTGNPSVPLHDLAQDLVEQASLDAVYVMELARQSEGSDVLRMSRAFPPDRGEVPEVLTGNRTLRVGISRAARSGNPTLALEVPGWLWLVQPLADAEGGRRFLVARMDMTSFLTRKLVEVGLPEWENQVMLTVHEYTDVASESSQGSAGVERVSEASLIMVPWLGFGNTDVIYVWPTRDGLSEWLGMGAIGWTSLCVGLVVSLTAMLLVGQFTSRQAELQRMVLEDAQRLELSESRLTRINDCFLGFGPDPEANIRMLTYLVGEVLEGDLALYNRIEEDRLRTMAAWNPPEELKCEYAPSGHLCTDIIRQNTPQPVVFEALQEGPYASSDPVVREFGVRTCIGQSIPFEEKGLGALSVMFTDAVTLPETSRSFLAAVAAAIRIEEQRRLAGLEVERKDHLLEAAANTTTLLLVEEDNQKAIAKGLEEIGQASRQDRVYIFEYVPGEEGASGVVNQRFEWVKEGVSVQMDNPDLQGVPFEDMMPRWSQAFGRGESIEGFVRDFPAEERAVLEPQEILSILAVPIFHKQNLWGFIGFDNCTEEYVWAGSERSILKSVASSIGASILRRETEATLKRQNEELKAAAERAGQLVEESDKANAAKGEFLARMSHEIRTPMNGVLSMSRLLEYEDMPPEQKEKLDVIIQSGEMLLHIINDILDFSRIEAGKLMLIRESFDLPVLLQSLHRLLAVKAQEKGIRYQHSLGEDVPRFVVGDPLRIRQILLNVIGNAIKFTEEGEVRIQVWREFEAKNQTRMVFEVSDTGEGIPEGQVDALFEEFRQLDGSSIRRHEGTGLGLSIVRGLVDRMAGEVEVESREGVGSTFRIKLPLPSSTGEMVMQDEVTTRAGLQGVRVLAVDDDPALARLLGRLLPSGTRLFDAGNARDGEEILLDHPEIELVFCDHELPGEQGLDFCTRMQESHYPQTRVLITGVTDTDFLHRALKSGAVDQVLSKPLDPSAIRKTFSEVMANRRGEDPTTGADAPDAVQIFHTELPILVAEDNKVNQLVARQYLQKLDLDCEVFPNGEEALEALKTGKYAAALMDLHMPRMDGLAATEAFRRWEEENGRPRLPVIALTADAIKGDREKCIKAGMDDYLSKPLRVADLTGVLRKFGLIRPAH